jgi:predicted carbohydrate-binding protein with CBM5 and CBM33 domain
LFQPIGFVERKLKHAHGGLSPAANRSVSNTVKLDSATIDATSTMFAAIPAISSEPNTTST